MQVFSLLHTFSAFCQLRRLVESRLGEHLEVARGAAAAARWRRKARDVGAQKGTPAILNPDEGAAFVQGAQAL